LDRLPVGYRLAKDLKERAWTDGATWDEVGVLSPKKGAARYRVKTFSVTLYDPSARAFVYHSNALDKKKGKTLQRELQTMARQSALYGARTDDRHTSATATDGERFHTPSTRVAEVPDSAT
jgi:hypothetical protein